MLKKYVIKHIFQNNVTKLQQIFVYTKYLIKN